MKTKKILSLAAAAAVALSMMAGLGVSAAKKAGPIETAVADTENWRLYNGLKTEQAFGNGQIELTNSDDTGNGRQILTYKGALVQPGKTLELKFSFQKGAAHWIALQLRTDNNSDLADFTVGKSYALWFTSADMSITIGTAKKKSLPAQLFDGTEHTLAVTVTDTAEGVKINAQLDGDAQKTIEWVDEAKTFGPERTGFAVDDFRAPQTPAELVKIGDVPQPDTVSALSEAVADTDNWLLGNIKADGAFADGRIRAQNGDTTDNNRFFTYRGALVEDAKKLSFDLRFDDKAPAGWTALMFRTPNKPFEAINFTSGQGYAVWITNVSVRLGIGTDTKKSIAADLFDGRVHTIDVTLTDTDGGVKIEVTVDGTSMEWVDDAKTFSADRTGFAIHDFSAIEGVELLNIADGGTLPERETPPVTEADPFADAFDSADNWYFSSSRFDNGKIVSKANQSGKSMVAFYRGPAIGTALTTSFHLKLSDVTDSWAAVMLLQPSTRTGVVEYWAMKSGYALFMTTKSMALTTGSGDDQKLAEVPFTDGFDPYNGKTNTWSVKIEDGESGLTFTVLFNGKQVLQHTVNGAHRTAGDTGFGYHQMSLVTGPITSFELSSVNAQINDPDDGGKGDPGTSDGGKTDDGKKDDGKSDEKPADPSPATGVAPVAAAVLAVTGAAALTLFCSRRKRQEQA